MFAKFGHVKADGVQNEIYLWLRHLNVLIPTPVELLSAHDSTDKSQSGDDDVERKKKLVKELGSNALETYEEGSLYFALHAVLLFHGVLYEKPKTNLLYDDTVDGGTDGDDVLNEAAEDVVASGDSVTREEEDSIPGVGVL